jgi:hypothetical protein
MQHVAGIPQARANVLQLESGIIPQNVIVRPALREKVYDEFHGETRAPDHGLSHQYLRIQCNAFFQPHRIASYGSSAALHYTEYRSPIPLSPHAESSGGMARAEPNAAACKAAMAVEPEPGILDPLRECLVLGSCPPGVALYPLPFLPC